MQEEEVTAEYKKIYNQLPPIVKDFLHDMSDLANEILSHSETNKMTINNIMICLGPCLRACPFSLAYPTTHFNQVFDA